jgi:hypothetical protein
MERQIGLTHLLYGEEIIPLNWKDIQEEVYDSMLLYLSPDHKMKEEE